MNESVQKRRAATAVAFVAVALVLIALSGLVCEGHLEQVQAAEGFRAEEVMGGSDPDKVLDGLERAVAAGQDLVPGYFRTEIGLAPTARDVRVDDAGRVVGYVLDCLPEQARKAVGKLMEKSGWVEVDAGGIAGATYMKEGGDCQWVLVTFTQVGSATSVVFRCVAR